jgi:hypothetical protein
MTPFGETPEKARGWWLGIYRSVVIAAVLGTFGWAWSISHDVTAIRAAFHERLGEHDKRLERQDERLRYLERRGANGRFGPP